MSKYGLCSGRTVNGQTIITLARGITAAADNAAKPFILSGTHPNGIVAIQPCPTMQTAVSHATTWHDQGYTQITIRDIRGGGSFPFSSEWSAMQTAV